MLSELYEKPRRNKDSVTEKSTEKNLCDGHHCFDCTPFFLSVICCFLYLLPPPSQVAYLLAPPCPPPPPFLYGPERWYSYFRYTGRLFLGCAPFVAVTLLQLYEKQRRNKDWATEESTRKNLCEGHHFFDRTRSFLCQFLLPYSFAIFPKWRTHWMVPIDIHIAMGGNLCYAENMKISCN